MDRRKNIRIVKFKPDHLDSLIPRDFERDHYGLIERFNNLYLEGPAYSVFDGEVCVFCGGVRIIWPGAGEAWLICSNDLGHYVRELCLITPRYLKWIIEDHDLRRVQAVVQSDWTQAVRFLEKLGFDMEGVMRKYGPNGEDYIMYARVKK